MRDRSSGLNFFGNYLSTFWLIHINPPQLCSKSQCTTTLQIASSTICDQRQKLFPLMQRSRYIVFGLLGFCDNSFTDGLPFNGTWIKKNTVIIKVNCKLDLLQWRGGSVINAFNSKHIYATVNIFPFTDF